MIVGHAPPRAGREPPEQLLWWKVGTSAKSALTLLVMAFLISFVPCDARSANRGEPCADIAADIRSAEQSLQKDDLKTAEDLLGTLQRSHPDCVQLTLTLARVRAAEGATSSSVHLFERAIELAPHRAQPYYYFAQFCFRHGDYRQADLLSDKAIFLDSRYVSALTLKGRLLIMKGQGLQARKMLERACALAPSNAEAHFQLGVLYDGEQLHLEAIKQFRKVIALQPDDPQAYDYLALDLESMGYAEQAARAFQQGLKVNKGPLFDFFLDYNYGRLLLVEGKLVESKEHLDRALCLAQQTRAVWYEHAVLNLRLHNYFDALSDANRVISLADPASYVLDLQLYYVMATAYARLGNKVMAQKYARLCRNSRLPLRSRVRK